MLTRELEIARKLAREAGDIVMQYYDTDYSVDLKKENEPVTLADKASNEFITTELKKAFPEDGILAEESKDDLSRLKNNRVWLVDPMDGTKEFIDKVGQFAVMIGLVEAGIPVLGVVYQPTTDTMFYALKSGGAYVRQNATEQKLATSDVKNPKDMRLVISRSHRAKLVDTMKEALAIDKEVASGSVGLKVGLLVRAKSDLYLHPNSKTKEWDTCAPQIILEEAGGRMTDCWGESLQYNKKNVYNERGFVASNGSCHDEIVERISPYLDELT